MNLYFIYTKNHSLLGLIRGRTQKSARNKAIKKWSKRRVSFVKIYKSNPNLIGTITSRIKNENQNLEKFSGIFIVLVPVSICIII